MNRDIIAGAGSFGSGGGGGYSNSWVFGGDDYGYRTSETPDDATKYTFFCFFKYDDSASYNLEPILDNTDGSDNGHFLRVYDHRIWARDKDASLTQWSKYCSTTTLSNGTWYALTVAVDTNLSTASDRVKIWVNNTLQTSFTLNTDPPQYHSNHIQETVWGQTAVGRRQYLASIYYVGKLADVHLIDGAALTPSDFYDTSTGTSYLYSGDHGTNGWHIDFSNASTVAEAWEDKSGEGNDLTAGGTQSIASNLSTDTSAGNP
jgi:hypothetical protein